MYTAMAPTSSTSTSEVITMFISLEMNRSDSRLGLNRLLHFLRHLHACTFRMK